MSLYRTLLLSLCAASALVATPALARPHDEVSWRGSTGRATRIGPIQKQRGQSMPLPQIDARPAAHGRRRLSWPEMRGRNLRMKFMDQGKVIWVDVDPMTAGLSASRRLSYRFLFQ